MHLVDKQHDVGVALGFLNDLFEPLLKFSLCACSSHERRNLEVVDAHGFEALRHLASHHAHGEPFDNRRLSGAWLSHQRHIALGLAREDLHDALNLGIAAYHGLEFALRRQFGEVDGIFLERRHGGRIARGGTWLGHGAIVENGLLQPLRGHAMLRHDGAHAVVHLGHCPKDVFGRHQRRVGATRQRVGVVEHGDEFARQVVLTGAVLGDGLAGHEPCHIPLERLAVDVQVVEQILHHVGSLGEQRHHHDGRGDVGMAAVLCRMEGRRDTFAALGRKVVKIDHRRWGRA